MTIKRIYSYEDEAGDTLIVERFDDDTPPGVMVSAHSKHRVVPVSLPQDEARKLAEALDPEKTATAWNTLIAELDAAEKRVEAHRVEIGRLTTKVAALQEPPRGVWYVEPAQRFEVGRRVERWKAWTPSREVVVETRAEAEAMAERWNGTPAYMTPEHAPPAPDRGADRSQPPPIAREIWGAFEAWSRAAAPPVEEEACAEIWALLDSLDSLAERDREQAAGYEARLREAASFLGEARAATAKALDERDDAERERDEAHEQAAAAEQVAATLRATLRRERESREEAHARGRAEGRREGLREAAGILRRVNREAEHPTGLVFVNPMAEEMEAAAAPASPKAAPPEPACPAAGGRYLDNACAACGAASGEACCGHRAHDIPRGQEPTEPPAAPPQPPAHDGGSTDDEQRDHALALLTWAVDVAATGRPAGDQRRLMWALGWTRDDFALKAKPAAPPQGEPATYEGVDRDLRDAAREYARAWDDYTNTARKGQAWVELTRAAAAHATAAQGEPDAAAGRGTNDENGDPVLPPGYAIEVVEPFDTDDESEVRHGGLHIATNTRIGITHLDDPWTVADECWDDYELRRVTPTAPKEPEPDAERWKLKYEGEYALQRSQAAGHAWEMAEFRRTWAEAIGLDFDERAMPTRAELKAATAKLRAAPHGVEAGRSPTDIERGLIEAVAQDTARMDACGVPTPSPTSDEPDYSPRCAVCWQPLGSERFYDLAVTGHVHKRCKAGTPAPGGPSHG